jgi:hypothetical protein
VLPTLAATCGRSVTLQEADTERHRNGIGTGGPLTFETAEFSRFDNGLLAHHTVMLNMLDLARQIGAVPQAGTLGARIGVWMQHVAARWARARRDWEAS